MFIEKLVVGEMDANCYILADEDTTEGIVIDPGGSADKIMDVIQKNNLDIKYVVNTHGHIDHIAANKEIIEATTAPLLIHQADANFLKDSELNLSAFLSSSPIDIPSADELLEAGSRISFGQFDLEVLHTPGHTKGSICLVGDNYLFSGDTLFCNGIGRTDLATGSRKNLNQSLIEIARLKQGLTVYPGHGSAATLAEIQEVNPYI
ncbi:MAG: MBL fold metallo-hydrolase [Bacillota bacterium]